MKENPEPTPKNDIRGIHTFREQFKERVRPRSQNALFEFLEYSPFSPSPTDEEWKKAAIARSELRKRFRERNQ